MLTLDDILIDCLDRAVNTVKPTITDPQSRVLLEQTLTRGFAALREGEKEAMRIEIRELRAWIKPELETA